MTNKSNLGARTNHLTSWFNCLKSKEISPKIIFTDKDIAEVKVIQTVWEPTGTQVKLCLWHALRQINKHILARPKAKPEAPKASPQQIATTAGDNESSEDDMEEGDGEKDGQFDPEEVPSYLQQFFRNPVVTAFLNTVKSAAKDKLLCTRQLAEKVLQMCRRYFLHHPFIPEVKYTSLSDGNRIPESRFQVTGNLIHEFSVMEMFKLCKDAQNPRLFRYLWANWYRRDSPRYQERWGLVSISDCPWIPRARTTMRVEAHW